MRNARKRVKRNRRRRKGTHCNEEKETMKEAEEEKKEPRKITNCRKKMFQSLTHKSKIYRKKQESRKNEFRTH